MERRTVFVIANAKIMSGEQSADDVSKALWEHIVHTNETKSPTLPLNEIYVDLRELAALENARTDDE